MEVIDLTAIQEALEEPQDDIELIHKRLDLISALLIKLVQERNSASDSTSVQGLSLQ